MFTVSPRTLLSGLKRLPREHFAVSVADCERRLLNPIRAPALSYYADPFLWNRDGRMWLLVEQFHFVENCGHLVAIELGPDLKPVDVVPLGSIGSHASFPFPLELGNQLYLLPETHEQNRVSLYRCEGSRPQLSLARVLLEDIAASDTVVLNHDSLWWLITSVLHAPGSKYLAIYYTDDLLHGALQPHPVNEKRLYAAAVCGTGRNAGPIVNDSGRLLRIVQNSSRYYGESVEVMEIARLSRTEYEERPFDGSHPVRTIADRCSPHHICLNGNVVAWDVRDRTDLRSWMSHPWPKKAGSKQFPHAAASFGEVFG
jgi:hypothetical protein